MDTHPHPDKIERLKTGQKVALISAMVIFMVALLKAVVGYRFNSQLLVADAFHSGADILINIISLLGLWLASRKKTIRFPYGLYRAETVACLIISGFIILIGFQIFNEGLEKLFQQAHQGKFPLFPVGAAAISAVTAFFLAIKQKSVGMAIGSQALMTTARESFFDIFISIVVLAGILLVHAGIPYAEGTGIILISVFILKLGIETAGTSLMILMDANLDIDLQAEVEEKLNGIYGVKGVCDVKIRRSGPFKIVECVIQTSPALSLYKAHEMADTAESLLLKSYESIESVFIHIEPERENGVSAIIPVRDMNGLNSKAHSHFGRAPYFIILKLDGDRIEIDDFYFNEFLNEKGHIGINVVKTVINYKINLLFISKIGEISFHMLKNNFVDIYKMDEGMTVKEIINLYHLNKLSPLTEPTHKIDTSQFAKQMASRDS